MLLSFIIGTVIWLVLISLLSKVVDIFATPKAWFFSWLIVVFTVSIIGDEIMEGSIQKKMEKEAVKLEGVWESKDQTIGLRVFSDDGQLNYTEEYFIVALYEAGDMQRFALFYPEDKKVELGKEGEGSEIETGTYKTKGFFRKKLVIKLDSGETLTYKRVSKEWRDILSEKESDTDILAENEEGTVPENEADIDLGTVPQNEADIDLGTVPENEADMEQGDFSENALGNGPEPEAGIQADREIMTEDKMNEIRDAYVGGWGETEYQLPYIEIAFEDDLFEITITYKSGMDILQWNLTGTYEADQGGIVYTGNYTLYEQLEETDKDTDQEGLLYIGKDGCLYWDDYADGFGDGYRFVKDDTEINTDTDQDDASGDALTENRVFYYYDGEKEITLELYPDTSLEGRVLLSMASYDESRMVLEEGITSGYYSANGAGYDILDDNGADIGVSFTLDLDTEPAVLYLEADGVTLELSDLEWIRQNAG